MKDKVRDAALRFLCDAERDKKYLNLALPSALAAFDDERDRALFTLLVYGVTEKQITLDRYLAAYSSRPVEELERFTRYILRLGFYQLIFLATPPHAAVNETVALARQQGERGFVNAVLRSYLREPEKAVLPKKEDGLLPYLSVRYSFPLWMCASLVRDYGEETAEETLEAFSRKAPLTLRVNTEKTSREELLALLSPFGARETVFSDCGIVIGENAAPSRLPGFDEGLFFVQDEASQLCARLLGAREGEDVADVCAAPGSKSFSLALDMKGTGRVRSFDLHRSKLSLIESGAARLGLENVFPAEQNALSPRKKLFGKLDRVLCDVPCSGLGVAAKKPDIRRKEETEVLPLPETSYAILDASSAYLREGGVLVYSTCTLRRAENDEVCRRFLAAHPEFSPLDFTFTGRDGTALPSENGMLTLLPAKTHTDGFFLCRMIKKGSAHA